MLFRSKPSVTSQYVGNVPFDDSDSLRKVVFDRSGEVSFDTDGIMYVLVSAVAFLFFFCSLFVYDIIPIDRIHGSCMFLSFRKKENKTTKTKNKSNAMLIAGYITDKPKRSKRKVVEENSCKSEVQIRSCVYKRGERMTRPKIAFRICRDMIQMILIHPPCAVWFGNYIYAILSVLVRTYSCRERNRSSQK